MIQFLLQVIDSFFSLNVFTIQCLSFFIFIKYLSDHILYIERRAKEAKNIRDKLHTENKEIKHPFKQTCPYTKTLLKTILSYIFNICENLDLVYI